MITKEQIKNIGFTEDQIYLELKSGEKRFYSLRNLPKLFNANKAQRENYKLSHFGIHWEDLDEDLSFDGFFKEQESAENEIADLFRQFPEISISRFAQRAGISPLMLRHYACGTKKPSEKRKKQIEEALHEFGKQLTEISL